MFIPNEIDLVVYKGSSFIQSFKLDVDGIPFVSDGWKARMQIRETQDASSFILELTTENDGIKFVENKNNEGVLESTHLRLYISPQTTTGIDVFAGVYDLELVDASGDVGRLMEGSVTFNPEVTR